MAIGLGALIAAAAIAPLIVSGLIVRAITVGLKDLFAVIARMADSELGRKIDIRRATTSLASSWHGLGISTASSQAS